MVKLQVKHLVCQGVLMFALSRNYLHGEYCRRRGGCDAAFGVSLSEAASVAVAVARFK